MTRVRCCFLVLLFCTATMAHAAPQGLGLGLILGDPTGISGKFWLDQKRAVDFAAAWSTADDDDDFEFHADYLLHQSGIVNSPPELRPLIGYYGIGARLHLGDDDPNNSNGDDHADGLGVRVPFGLAWHFNGGQVDAFFEIAPVMDLVPETDLDVDAAIGARFYFR